jgi:DNA helicase HerA-like ATPase
MDLSNVRIREHFGLVTNDTHTGQFSFLVSPPKNRGTVEKQDYVLIDHPLLGESCPVLAEIKEITSYEEVTGSTIGERMGKMLATADVIGFVDLKRENRPLQKMLLPPNPGGRVYVPLGKFLEDTLNRNVKGEFFTQPLYLGKLEASTAEEEQTHKQINCFIDAQELTTKHTIIAAMTGAGKTHTAKVIVQELATKTKTPIVIVDQAGEYTDIQDVESPVIVLAAKPEKVAKKIQNKKIVIKSLNEKNEKETLAKEVKPGQITILNGKGLMAEERRTFFAYSLKTLWKNRTDEITEPFFLLIEEA